MSEIAALVADNLDIWTGAVERKSAAGRGGSGKRISLYGIERLRALILKLAVLGKLVPQDPADEPAAELLTKIAAERKSLQQAGTISKPKKLPPVDANNLTLPENWVAARFGSIFSLEYGDNLPERMRSGTGEYNVFGSNGVVGTHDSFKVEQPCLVIGRKGSAGAINKSYQPSWVTDVAYYCVPPTGIELDFQYILFRTLGLEALGKGIKPGLNRNEANVLTVVLPPLAEQRRIVAKVDELMALCDALERESANALASHQTLVETLLAKLVSSADAADLAANGARLENHFDTLFTTEASIDALKKTILDLAVRGKLVEQDAGDEAADKMLSRIASDRTKSGKPGKGRASTNPHIADTEVPFEIPHSWAWARFSQVAAIRAELVQSLDFPDAVQIAPDVIEKGTGKLLTIRTVAEAGVRGPNSRFYAGQIIYSKIRPSLSKAVIAEYDGLCSADMYPLDVRIETNFLLRLILSEPFLQQVRIAENRIKMPKLNKESLNAFVVPIPPLAEQRRIVAKVDELMALCDTLKTRLADAVETRRHVADAIVERAVA